MLITKIVHFFFFGGGQFWPRSKDGNNLSQIMEKRRMQCLDSSFTYFQPECTNVCFRYIPPKIACMSDGPAKDERLGKVSKITL